MNEQINEQTNNQMNERMNKRTTEQRNKQRNEQRNEWINMSEGLFEILCRVDGKRIGTFQKNNQCTEIIFFLLAE